jgi:UDP-2-acetamido-3-amino-2,3-dideoxy-glucuronate N-acetyltransferase
VVGNPARQLGWVGEYGHRLNFDTNSMATCPESGQQYLLNDNQVKRIS